MKALLQKLALAFAALGMVACTNHVTPEGHQGYVYEAWQLERARYVETVTGPTSTGLTFRKRVINVDIRPKNYTEAFTVLSKDNLLVGFQAHARVSIRPNAIKPLVEEYGSGDLVTSANDAEAPEWFVRGVRQPYRSAVRDFVYTLEAYAIQTKTQEISASILQRLRDEFAESPIEFEAISIGNIAYPPAINAEIQRKLAAEQDLERMGRELQIAEQEAQIMVTTAKGRANAQRIVNETLTPLYVQHEMLESFRELARSPRVTLIAAPTGAQGAPIMVNLGEK